MKKYLLSIAAVFCLAASIAQLPEDVLRNSYYPQHGTARNLAIGGAMGSLGGDINALFVNPAGLGMFKTREVEFSPGFIFNNNKANFRGTSSTSKNSGFDIGTSGVIIGFNSPGSKWTNQAFSFGINQTANFNNSVAYKGSNNLSSFSEQYAEQFSQSGLYPDEALNNPRFAYGTAPALYTYLIDTFSNAGGGVDVKALPEFLLAQGIALDQQKTIETSGGIYELALGYAANMSDKLYLGGSLGVPVVSYTRNTFYRESDPSGNKNNDFDFFEFNDQLTTKGFGVNAKLGLIYKPAEYFRVGLALHSPTYYSLTDRETASMTTNTEGYAGLQTVSSETFTQNLPGKTLYTATSPWKAIFSGSYVIREVNDTRRQRGFISADVEYVGYGGSNFKADGENVTNEDIQYYKDLKSVVNQSYKGAFNYRLGGELKFNTIMFRLGGAYYSSPYKDKALKSNITQASGGIGYRNYGMFIDLTYVQTFNKDVNFPYRLSDKPNTYAEQKNNRGNIVLTVGFKI